MLQTSTEPVWLLIRTFFKIQTRHRQDTADSEPSNAAQSKLVFIAGQGRQESSSHVAVIIVSSAKTQKLKIYWLSLTICRHNSKCNRCWSVQWKNSVFLHLICPSSSINVLFIIQSLDKIKKIWINLIYFHQIIY